MDNKLALEALDASHLPEVHRLEWLNKNKARALDAAETYEAQSGQAIPIDPSTWLGYKVPTMRIHTVRRCLNTQFSVLAMAVKRKEPTKDICSFLFGVLKQIV